EQVPPEPPKKLDLAESSKTGTTRSSSSMYFRCDEKSVAFAVLEASLLSENGWLCGEAFRFASVAMGSGDGKGLPPNPR
ncbi:unnamed protein product, partial [Laminaria digitata]